MNKIFKKGFIVGCWEGFDCCIEFTWLVMHLSVSFSFPSVTGTQILDMNERRAWTAKSVGNVGFSIYFSIYFVLRDKRMD